jgi:hypothetical protein
MSRFPKTLKFPNLPPSNCAELLMRKLRENDLFEVRAEDHGGTTFMTTLCSRFDELQHLGGWANARDVINLNKKLVQRMMALADETASGVILVREDDVFDVVDDLISERKQRHLNLLPRSTNGKISAASSPAGVPQSDFARTANAPAPPTVRIETAMTSAMQDLSLTQIDEEQVSADPIDASRARQRDVGVSDQTWNLLLAAERACEEQEQDYQNLLTKVEESESEASEPVEVSSDTPNADGPDDIEEERKRKMEEARIRRELARRETDRLRRELEAKEAARKLDQEAQRKLRVAGVCVAGYRWIPMQGGYRCAGGSHFVSDAQLAGMP